MLIDVRSTFQGISTPLNELYQQVEATGWQVKKVGWSTKFNSYLAVGQNPYGEQVEKTGNTPETAIANILIAVTRKNNIRTTAQWKVGMWKTMFTDQLQPIAEAYAQAAVYEPKAAAAFKELADDSTRRANVLRQQLTIEVTDNPEPYANAQEMAEDIHKRKHFVVSRAHSEHPIWTPEQNVDFRIVHDVLGHAVSGGDFGWQGENLACAAHFPLLSATAQGALFCECIAQTAYAAYYRSFGPQKVALFPQFYEPAQQAEGVGPSFQGVHPSQTTAPVAMPSVAPSPSTGLPKDNIPPHEYPQIEGLGLSPFPQTGYLPSTGLHFGAFSENLADPNSGWSSGIEPMEPNAYLHHGDPMEGQSVMDNARLIDTEWSELKDGEGKPDYERMKLAIVNAFRAVLLSPRKDLRWNTIHYQDLMGVPPGVTDPAVYWNALEHKRQEWNVNRFGEESRYAHLPYARFVPQFENIIYQMNPQQGWANAKERAQQIIYDWRTEEQERLMGEDADLPEEKQRSSDEIERRANEALAKRLNLYIKEFQPKLDFASKTAEQQPLFESPIEPRKEIPGRYGAWMGTHLKAIAQISQHVDELLKAALEDVHEHDGAGHHFRSAVLQMGISGVGPKVASFAWLLLQPMTSQLATIDTHMMDVLGRHYEKDMNNRDYFKFERELAAGRDAAGYSHIPLGAFQWGMWDFKRTGPGSHQDHSGLKVLTPQPHETIDWQSKAQNLKGDNWTPPDWWNNTQAARNQVGQEWDENVAPAVAANQIPYNVLGPVVASQRVSKPTRPDQFYTEWNKREPIHMDEAKVLGEYAAGAKFSKSEIEGFLDAHEDDVHVDFPDTYHDFREEFLKWFDRYHQSSVKSAAEIQRTPVFKHPDTGEIITGMPGETIMQHAVKTLGLSTPEVWQRLVEVGKV